MEVKVKKLFDQYNNLWYEKHVGQVFEVTLERRVMIGKTGFPGLIGIYILTDGTGRFIYAEDAEEVT